MKNVSRALLSGLFLVCSLLAFGQQTAVVSTTSAIVPPLVKFSGVLSDLNGRPLSGTVGVTFALYKDQQGGPPLWLETQNVQLDKSGHYSVMLGSTSGAGLPAEIFAGGEARWLGFQPQGQAEQPRVLLLSVPYALKAGDAQTLGGLPSSAFVLAAPPTAGSAVAAAGATGSGSTSASGVAPATSLDVTTTGGTVSTLPMFSTSTNIQNSILTQTGTSSINVVGKLIFPSNGTATASKGADSQPEVFVGSAFNSTSNVAANQKFQWQVEPASNDTASPSGTLNLLYASGTAAPAETGLHIASSGQITFATGQTFPGTGTGNGTITGVNAGTDLTGGGTTGSVALSLDTSKVPQLATANTFTGSQTVNGNLSATGAVTAGSYQIGSNLFAFGTYGSGNAFLGFAGNTTMTGINNTGIGYAALAANLTGAANTANGYEALNLNTIGTNNTASGFEALGQNSTGSDNSANGERALFYNTTGGQNTAYGKHALYSNTTASGNTANGYSALYSNTTASGNTANGYSALYSNTVGQDDTATGYQALFSNTGDNLGKGDGNHNSADGYQALYSNTLGQRNTASGYQALYSNTGDSSGDGGENTADGDQALYSNTSGRVNTAIGDQALYSNTSGQASTAVGAGALYFNTIGTSNSGVGDGALYYNTTGGQNSAFGDAALTNNTTGGNNTAVGENSLYGNSTGSELTCVGYQCNVSADSLNNATAIGAHAVVSESNALVLGGTGAYAVKVGIGTAAPSNILTIAQGAGHPVSDGWETFSSRRWKTNIEPLHDALGKVEQLRGVSYDLKSSGKHEIGVIAEEVGAVVPEVVSYEENKKDARSVDYSRLTALLIESTKEQQREFQRQQTELTKALLLIKGQQARLREQGAAMRTLKAEVRATRQTVRNLKAQAAAQPALVAAK